MTLSHAIPTLALASVLFAANLANADTSQNVPDASTNAETAPGKLEAKATEQADEKQNIPKATTHLSSQPSSSSTSLKNTSEVVQQLSEKNEEMHAIKRGELSELLKRKYVNIFANGFHQLLLRGRAEDLKKISASEFFFEGRKVETDEDYALEMERIVSSPNISGLKVSRYQVFSPEEMERSFGPRPARLADWPVTEDAYFSVAEIGDSALVILWVPAGDYYAAAAIHD